MLIELLAVWMWSQNQRLNELVANTAPQKRHSYAEDDSRVLQPCYKYAPTRAKPSFYPWRSEEDMNRAHEARAAARAALSDNAFETWRTAGSPKREGLRR